jgi:SAM-dependent methyltransferase
MIIPPRELTLSRLFDLVNHPEITQTRYLQYEKITGVTLEGKILDVGGGLNTSYYHLFSVRGQIHSLNISSKIDPTIVGDATRLPIAPNSYDTIICLNTLEHLRNDTTALQEFLRVLAVNGRIHILVPFLYRVHGSPSDYHRHTGYFWEETIMEVGFDPKNIVVEPLTFGANAASLSMVEFYYPSWVRRFLRLVVLGWPLLIIRLRQWLRRGPSPYTIDAHEFPLAYYVCANK